MDLDTLPFFYHFLLDLLGQSFHFREKMVQSQDDVGNSWLKLRGVAPYRDRGIFSDTTTVINRIGALVRVIFAESEEDIDNWYLYEWLSPHVKDVLAGGQSTELGKVGDQRSILNHVFKKFSKLFTQ